MCFICAGRDFNRALLSGLIAEEWTRQLLDIAVGERDYRVALSEENLRVSRRWAFVEERSGTAALPVDLLFDFTSTAAFYSRCVWRERLATTNG